jgi:hypothetical protein
LYELIQRTGSGGKKDSDFSAKEGSARKWIVSVRRNELSTVETPPNPVL